ncbi:MAG: MmcQ/YjbR family DNA-binding protein, partial [Rhodanobacter sp.]
ADERFLELTDQPGVVPAPYLAQARSVSVTEPRRFATAALEALVLEAYVTVRAKLPKKAQAALGPLPTLESAR